MTVVKSDIDHIESLRQKVKQLEKQLSKLGSTTASIQKVIHKDLEDQINDIRSEYYKLYKMMLNVYEFKNEFYELAVLVRNDLKYKRNKIKRYLPCEIYLDTEDDNVISGVEEAVQGTVNALAFDTIFTSEPIKNSWWRKFLIRSDKELSHMDVSELLKKIQKALEMQALNKPQAGISKELAEAAKLLIESIANVKNACILIGSILIVKHSHMEDNNRLFVKELSQHELEFIRSHNNLLKEPHRVLEELQRMALLEIDEETKAKG